MAKTTMRRCAGCEDVFEPLCEDPEELCHWCEAAEGQERLRQEAEETFAEMRAEQQADPREWEGDWR